MKFQMIKYFASNSRLSSSGFYSIVCDTCVMLGLVFEGVFRETNGLCDVCVVVGDCASKARLP